MGFCPYRPHCPPCPRCPPRPSRPTIPTIPSHLYPRVKVETIGFGGPTFPFCPCPPCPFPDTLISPGKGKRVTGNELLETSCWKRGGRASYGKRGGQASISFRQCQLSITWRKIPLSPNSDPKQASHLVKEAMALATLAILPPSAYTQPGASCQWLYGCTQCCVSCTYYLCHNFGRQVHQTEVCTVPWFHWLIPHCKTTSSASDELSRVPLLLSLPKPSPLPYENKPYWQSIVRARLVLGVGLVSVSNPEGPQNIQFCACMELTPVGRSHGRFGTFPAPV